MLTILPALIVFDLDLTLWNFTFDIDVKPPFSKDSHKNGTVRDSTGKEVKYFEEVPQLLALLHEHDIKLAVVSQSANLGAVHQLLETLEWKKYLTYYVIHSGNVKAHLKELNQISKVRFSDMLYFDNSFYTVRQARHRDIVGIMVPNGITPNNLKTGLDEFVRHRGITDQTTRRVRKYSRRITVTTEEIVKDTITESLKEVMHKEIDVSKK